MSIMKKINLFIPQWQGSGITKELFDGSYALKELIEEQGNCSFNSIKIDSNSIPELKHNIMGFDIIMNQLGKVQNILDFEQPDKIFTIGGGCGIEIPIVSFLKEKHKDLTLYWFDAHGDLNTPQSSPSKHFHGMPLRFLTEKIDNPYMFPVNLIPAEDVNLSAVRDLDEPERQFIEKNQINLIPVEEIRNAGLFNSRISSKNENAFIHIDLDVLDPVHYRNVKCPTEGGLSIEELTAALEIIKNNCTIVGFSIVENTELDKKEILKLMDIINIGIHFL